MERAIIMTLYMLMKMEMKAEESRYMTAPEWYFELTTQAKNAISILQVASMGYDPGYDLPAPPCTSWRKRMISYNPSWDVLGDEYSICFY